MKMTIEVEHAEKRIVLRVLRDAARRMEPRPNSEDTLERVVVEATIELLDKFADKIANASKQGEAT